MKKIAFAVLLTFVPFVANAQSIGGNASISANGTSARVALPSTNHQLYPSLIIAPASGATTEIFYALGNSSVVATTTSSALPSGGICIDNVGPAIDIAAITGGTAASVRLTQQSSCTPFAGGYGGGGSTAITATAASSLPTISAGAGALLYESLGAGLYSQPVFGSASGGGTQVDSTHGLPVNIVAGGIAGIAQGAVYGSQTFSPVMGLASTNAPTATTGDLWALSISPYSGGVRVDLKDSAANTNAFLVTGTGGTFPVTGAFYQATQPMSIASAQVVANAFADGFSPSIGSTTDAPCSVPMSATGCSLIGAVKATGNTAANSIAAGSNIIGKMGIDQTTDGTTNGVHLVAGSNVAGKVGVDQTTQGTTNGVTNGAHNYFAYAASTGITAIGGGSGAAGDYLSHCTFIPATTSPGVGTITDGSTAIYSFAGGASSVSNLVPFTIPVGAIAGTAWKITTGANISAVCVGKFT